MKTLLKTILFLCFVSKLSYGQEVKNKLYNPNADAKADISKAFALADSTGKHVLIQIGGNWCKWCIRFNKFCKEDHEIDSVMQSSYVVVHLNYSTENTNLEILKTLQYPQRFGFPVIVILDGKGKQIHTQDTGLLESGDGYDGKKVMNFFKDWSPFALNPKNFEK
ncbi:MAG: thioredoxin family protein [Bacteroidales bacterium]